jgi:hypothetical protein
MTIERLRQSNASLVLSLIALIVSVTGGAYAAVTLKQNQVKSKHIAPEAVHGVDADESSFATVPSAAMADDADKLDGIDSSAFVRDGEQPVSFIQTVNTGVGGNSCGGGTVIDQPAANGNPNAQIIVTRNLGQLDAGRLYTALAVFYDLNGGTLGCGATNPPSSNHWVILPEDEAISLSNNMKINVLVRP